MDHLQTMKLERTHQTTGCKIYKQENNMYYVQDYQYSRGDFATLSEAISYCDGLYSNY
jgi:hypothetical protein